MADRLSKLITLKQWLHIYSPGGSNIVRLCGSEEANAWAPTRCNGFSNGLTQRACKHCCLTGCVVAVAAAERYCDAAGGGSAYTCSTPTLHSSARPTFTGAAAP